MTLHRTREFPRYGIRDDEMTRPGKVLHDFRARWHAIGRSAGAVLLGIVLGMWVAIDLFAMLAPEALGNMPGRPPADATQR